MDDLKTLGFFETINSIDTINISLSKLKIGINDIGNYILKLNHDRTVDYVIDKVCDHAGGHLIVKGEQAICPMHDWKLNLDSLKYNNDIYKKSLDYELISKDLIKIPNSIQHLSNPFKSLNKGEVKFRWLNHATIHIECGGMTLITDPWLFGPAFLTGWWLATPSPKDSIELLKNADYVYVSHNHPDHLHPETLSLISKNKTFLVPNFKSKSCQRYLISLGFTNIHQLDFKEIFELNPKFQISILKSGDFRDDSGIYICADGYEFILTVDANFLNSYVLPKNIDFLMSSFAGGASGFPLCYSNFTEEEKLKVLNRNRNSVKFAIQKNLDAVKPKYYLPYAGMFKEKAKRDTYILDVNKKNSITDLSSLVKAKNCTLLQPLSNIEYICSPEKPYTVNENQLDAEYLLEENTDFYIQKLKEEYPYNAGRIIEYFEKSGFVEKNIIQIIPVNDVFEEIIGEIVLIDFHNHIFKVIEEEELINEKKDYKVMKLKIRAEVLMCAVENKLPWEDISIGFQMRVTREPNEYESNFWYYFTNVYIGKKDFRQSSFCGACTIIDQNPIWIKNSVNKT